MKKFFLIAVFFFGGILVLATSCEKTPKTFPDNFAGMRLEYQKLHDHHGVETSLRQEVDTAGTLYFVSTIMITKDISLDDWVNIKLFLTDAQRTELANSEITKVQTFFKYTVQLPYPMEDVAGYVQISFPDLEGEMVYIEWPLERNTDPANPNNPISPTGDGWWDGGND